MILGIRSLLRSVLLADTGHRIAVRGILGLAAVALVVAAGMAAPSLARANGVPVMVELSYIDLSNWGPQDATGTAEIVFAEGIVRVSAQGLPRLDGSLYQAWLVNSEVGDAISAGRFNASVAGHVAYQGTLPPIADFGFDLFILTVEPDPDNAPQPTQDRSIGGYFSLVGVASPDGTGGEAAAGGLQGPASLPDTGDAAFVTDMVRVGALASAMALSVLVGLRLSRRTS
jgi:hypothetical protein